MISIIIPVYNVAQYLDQCLQSVLAQSYTDWECILVDDGSKDGSGVKCDEWCNRDSRFRVIHQKNQGVSAARNNGIKATTGEYIAFIDSDDWVGVDYLKDMYEAEIMSGADLIVTGLTKVYEDTGLTEEVIPRTTGCYLLDAGCANVFLENIGLVYGPSTKLYKTSLIKNNAILYPAGISLGEDMIFNFSYLKVCSTIYYKSVSHYLYRQQSAGLCNRIREDFYDVLIHQWRFRRDTLQEMGIWNTAIEEYFSKQLWGYTYDCIFSFGKQPYSKIKHILDTLDIVALTSYEQGFSCSQWIKKCIKNQIVLPLYIITHIKS